MAANEDWKDEFLVPGYENEELEHLKAGAFVYSLATALRPLNESQQTIIMHAMLPLFDQINVTAVPTTFTVMATRIGLQNELNRKLCRVDYCTDYKRCGFMKRTPLVQHTPQAMHHCVSKNSKNSGWFRKSRIVSYGSMT